MFTLSKSDFSRQQNTEYEKVLIINTSNLFVNKQVSFSGCVEKCKKKKVKVVLSFRNSIKTNKTVI